MSTNSFRSDVAANGVLTLTLDRPDKLNALTFDVYRELTDTFARLQHDDAVRAVIITGTGRAFCSGGDVNDIIGKLVSWSGPELLRFTRMTGELIRNMRRLRKPIVAALNGVAAGAGAVIALAADFRVMASTGKLAFLFVKVGLAGADMGAAWLLQRAVGTARATELLMLGDAIDSATCERYGLANKVALGDDVMVEARRLADRLAAGPTFALGMTKELLNAEAHMGLEEAIEAEAQAQQICMGTKDFREAYEAFIGKREPKFVGR